MTHSNILHILYTENSKLKLIQVPEYSLVYLKDGGILVDNYFEYIPEDMATYQNRELSENKLIIKRSDLIVYGLPSAFRFGDGLSEVSNENLREVIGEYIDNEYIKDIRDYGDLYILNSTLGSPIKESEFVVDDISIKYSGELVEVNNNQVVFKVIPYFGDVDIYSTLTMYRAGDGILHINRDDNEYPEVIDIDKGTVIYLIS